MSFPLVNESKLVKLLHLFTLSFPLLFSFACSDEGDDSGGSSGSMSEENMGEEEPAPSGEVERPAQPNFVVFLADDMGWDDFGRNNPIVRTPNLDALAENGVRFDRFYAQPVCTTTRASLLTGKFAQEVGVWDVHGGRDFLDLGEKLLVERLRDAGYATGLFGKWHNGFSSAYRPEHRGFDEAYTAHLYSHFNNTFTHNGEELSTRGWVTEKVTDFAMEFIDSSLEAEKPFVAYVPFLAPHEPWIAPDEFIEPYLEDGMSEAMATVLAMVSHLDHHVGRVMAHLEERGVADDTVVFFMSDNGPWRSSSNGLQLSALEWRERNPTGLRQHKGEVYENGIRTPLYADFGAHFEGRDSSAVLGVQDVFPTMLELAGVELPEDLDGASFAQHLEDESAKAPEKALFFAKHSLREGQDQILYGLTPDKESLLFGEQIWAVRRGDYKIVRTYGGELELFNVIDDPGERTDLAETETEIAMELGLLLQERWERVLLSETSFGPGVELIGFDDAVSSRVSVRTAMNRSATVLVNSWTSENWTALGDFVEMRVDVRTAGTYDLSLDLETMNDSGVEVTTSLGAASASVVLDSAALGASSSRTSVSLGAFELAEGEQTLRFEITGLGSDTALNPLGRFYGVELERL